MMQFKIGRKELILTDEYLSYSNKKILLNEILDFDYQHEYSNGVGGIKFKIKGRNNKIEIELIANKLIRTKKKSEDLKKVENLANTLFPIINTKLISKKITQLNEGKSVKIWKLIFDKNEISMRTRSSFWTEIIALPYNEAEIYFNQNNLGLFGHKGHANKFILKNTKSNEEHTYSRDPDYQPTQGKYSQIKALFNYLKDRSNNK